MDFEVIRDLLAALEREGVRYAVFGAVAMGIHGLARFTEDLDLFVDPDADNVARLRQAIRTVVDDPDVDQITASDLQGDYPVVQYIPPDGSFHIDIVSRLGDAFAFAELPTERLAIDGQEVTVVTARGLYAMKRNTLRGKDRADAAALRERFDLLDEDR